MSTLRLIARRMAAEALQKAELEKPAAAAAEALGVALRAEISKAMQVAMQDIPRSRPVAVPDYMQEIQALRTRLSALEQQKQQPKPAVMPAMKIERDGAGLARTVVIGDRRFLIQRNAEGRVVSLSPAPEIAK